ncbi:Mrr restriction system protein [Candidatus Dojkabacteria bacterium]|nr:Mrr restriction system protein [Candidatus Dojkabacteria bacterium]
MSKSKEVAIKTLYKVFEILKRNNNQLPGKEVLAQIEKEVEFTDWEKERYEKTGYIRWQSIIHFYTIDAIKSGHLYKKNGIWYLTEEGAKAMKLGPEKLFESAREGYKKWASERPDEVGSGEHEDTSQSQKANLEQLEEQAFLQLEDYIRSLNPYEFQDIVAALLRGMGYYTPFVAPRGKDNGIDIIAYKDPIGTEKPIIKVQVKHHPDSSVQSQDIQKLKGTLSHDEEVGIFVTSGKFSSGAIREARMSKLHIETIDFTRFVELWKQFYNKLSDEDKNLLPLHPIYFLGTNE